MLRPSIHAILVLNSFSTMQSGLRCAGLCLVSLERFSWKRHLASYIGPASSREGLDKLLSKLQPQPQIALVARSNVGKSSLVNALLGEKLAIVSKTPGRTRVAHAYQGSGFILIDLPGYGYAKGAGGAEGENMSNVIYECAIARVETNLVLFLLDARRLGMLPSDGKMQEALETEDVPHEIVFTKLDQINPMDLGVLKMTYPSAWYISSKKNIGIHELRESLKELNQTRTE